MNHLPGEISVYVFIVNIYDLPVELRKNCEENFTVGDMISPKFANVMLMRTDEREFLQLHRGEWCVILEVGEKKLRVFHEGVQWWVSNLAMVVISSRVTSG